MVAKAAGRHIKELQPNFNDIFVDVDFSSLTNNAAISDILSATEELMEPGTSDPLRETEKSIHLIDGTIQLFTHFEGNVFDSYGETFSAAIPAIRVKQCCSSIKKHEACSSISLKRIFLLLECLHLEAFLNVAGSMSASALGSALKQMSATKCVNDESDDGKRLLSEVLSFSLSSKSLIGVSDSQMQAPGEGAELECSEAQYGVKKDPDNVDHRFCTIFTHGPPQAPNPDKLVHLCPPRSRTTSETYQNVVF